VSTTDDHDGPQPADEPDLLDDPADDPDSRGEEGDEGLLLAPRFADVRAFVVGLLAHAWARRVRETDGDFCWCPHWHQHPVVVERLTALWDAYEHARTQGGTGLTRWWREADQTRTQLTAPKGPFARCGPEGHQLPPPLPTAPDPAAPLDAAAVDDSGRDAA